MAKKIGLLIPDLQSGGAERVMATTSNLLYQAGYDVYFFLFDNDNVSYNHEGKVITFNLKSGSNLFSKIFTRIMRIIKFSYYINKYNIDVTISFLYPANVVNYLSLGKVTKFLSCRGYRDFIDNNHKYSQMLKKENFLIVQTQRMKHDMVSTHSIDPNRVHVLANPFNVNDIKIKSEEVIEEELQNFIRNHKTICTVGSFKKDKGFWHLIKAFKSVKKSIPEAALLIIGHNGEMEKDIKSMVKNSEYRDSIRFLGYQNNPFKYMGKCQLYVCSSIHEGYPNSLVEAMSCGLPVVSTDCKTGPKEILCEQVDSSPIDEVLYADYGVLVPSLDDRVNFDISDINDAELVFAEAITQMLSDEKKLKCYAYLSTSRVQNYHYDTYLKQLENLFKEKLIAN